VKKQRKSEITIRFCQVNQRLIKKAAVRMSKVEAEGGSGMVVRPSKKP